MIDSELARILIAERQAELRREAHMAQLAASVRRRRRPISLVRIWRRGVTVEIHLAADVRPEQVDEFFATLARHLGTV
jgi:hypothetical protein